MPGDLFDQKLSAGGASIGLWIGVSDLVEVSAYTGFDWFMVDQMFSANDWQRTDELIRAGEAAGIPAIVRVQGFPWLGYDHRVALEVARASGIGAQYVMIPASGPREVEDCIRAARDWHRRVLSVHRTGADASDRLARPGALLIPHLETRESLDALGQIIAYPEIEHVFIAVTDASRALSADSRGDFYNPRLWEYIDRAVELGRDHNTVVGANTGFGQSLDEMCQRVKLLHQHGVRMIMVQGANFLFQLAATRMVSEFTRLVETDHPSETRDRRADSDGGD